MSLTIDLTPETEKKLHARAAASGKDVAVLARELIEEKLRELPTFAEVLAPVHQDFRDSAMSEEDLDTLLQETLEETRKARREQRPDQA